MSLASAAFVHAYCFLQSNLMERVYKIGSGAVPLPTAFFGRLGASGYVLPLLVLVFSFAGPGSEEKRENLIWAVFLAATLLSLLWMMAAVLSWQLPYYVPVAFIK